MDLRTSRFTRRFFGRSDCPSQQELAGYADRQLIGLQRHAVERHLSSCDACVQQVAFLVRTAQMDGEPVPPELMRSAVALPKQGITQSYPIWKLAVSGAFAILLLGVVGWKVFQHRPEANRATENALSSQTVAVAGNHATPLPHDTLARGNESSESPFLFPSPKQRVDAANLIFRWSPVHGARLYEIQLVTDDGSPVWTENVKSSQAALPSRIHLAKGATYFVRLRIHTARGSVDVTKAVEFIVE